MNFKKEAYRDDIKKEGRQDRDGKYVWYELKREGGSYMTS